jgi:hypothetical protein
VAAVRSEASGYWRTVTLPSLGMFASTMQTYRERLREAARDRASQYDTIKSEAQRRLGTLFNASDYPKRSIVGGGLPVARCLCSARQQ